MKIDILIGCEESGILTSEFRKLGLNAWSCDLMETSGNYPEYHIQADVFNVKSHDYQTAASATSSSSKVNLVPISVESLTNDIYLSATWTSSNSNCATQKTFYITSRGHFFSAQGTGGVELEFNLTTNMYGTKLAISGENAIARLYVREKLNAYSDL
jgi:hypothetical protein